MTVFLSSRGQGCLAELQHLPMTPLSHKPDFVLLGQAAVLYLDNITLRYIFLHSRFLRLTGMIMISFHALHRTVPTLCYNVL